MVFSSATGANIPVAFMQFVRVYLHEQCLCADRMFATAVQ